MSWLENDILGPEATIVEGPNEDGRQALNVRVGPVFYDDGSDSIAIWVEYQAHYLLSSVQGPILVDVATWHELTEAVNFRLRRAGLYRSSDVRSYLNACRCLFRTVHRKWLKIPFPGYQAGLTGPATNDNLDM